MTARAQLGIELIPNYSPETRDRSERMSGTLRKRLPQEFRLAGITDIAKANRFLKGVYLPAHNARFAVPPRHWKRPAWTFAPTPADRVGLVAGSCPSGRGFVPRFLQTPPRDDALRHGGTMSRTWQVHEAKARFSAFLEASAREGPQIVTKRGTEAAVLLPIEQWRRLQKMAQPDLKELLLRPEARTETLTPPRERHSHRPTSAFE